MNADNIDALFSEAPLIAILRGVQPEQVVAYGKAIVDSGWRCIEVPLNSPSPLESIRNLYDYFGDSILTGAGTVLSAADVKAVVSAGGKLIVAPNTDASVVTEALAHNAVIMPGFLSATEAFQAYAYGARYLKLFPADAMGPAYIKAIRSVLPADARIIPVGGVTPDNLQAFREAGSAAFGVGSQLFKPGMSVDEVRARAEDFMSACKVR
ncbi:MAG: 2-dehydro-3-deoxy-6-phosphogalactonate aldolase [Micavibrio sp.]|nr:2-dehydro-3-deoxy-6-phosphogalactonate aldolase [Micavibrio sp.]